MFGPQLSGVARPPLHVPVQLLRRGGDLSASRFHVGRLLRGATLATDVSPDSCLLIRVWTAEPAVPLSRPPLFSGPVPAQDAALTASRSPESVFAGGQIPGPSEGAVLLEITELKEDVPGISWTGPLSTHRSLIRPFPGGPFISTMCQIQLIKLENRVRGEYVATT